MERPKTATRRPRSASQPQHRSTYVRTSSPSGSVQLPELDISGVSAISISSRHDVTRTTTDGASRQAQLEKYKACKEAKEFEYDMLEAKALILEAELTWAAPPDLLKIETKNKQTYKKIAENTKDIEMYLEFCRRVSLLSEAQIEIDQTQKRHDRVKIPSPDNIKTLEELVEILKGTQLVETSVRLPQGDELLRLKPRLEQLFSDEEQRAVENGRKYAENMAQLTEIMKNSELASDKLIQIEKEKEMWERYVKSYQESLELAKIYQEELRRETPEHEA